MHLLDQSILLNMLGWTLFNSLWQMSFMWLAYMIVTACGKNFSANTRHSIALFLLGTGSLWFTLSLIINFFNGRFAQAAITFNILSNSKLSFIISCKQFINFLLPYCSFAYLVTLSFLVVRYLKYYILSQHLKQTGLYKAPVELRIFIEDIAARIGINKNVKLWLSSAIQSPMTIGFLKPVILVPLSIINHLSTQQMEAVLLHELAHIKRHDYLVNLLIAITEIIFFYNPFAMLLVHSIKKERENSCDDLVIQFRYDSCTYASALLSLEKARINHPQLAMAIVGKNKKMLLQRVMRITGHKNYSRDNKPRLVLFILIAITAAFAALVKPQEIVANIIRNTYANSSATPSEVQEMSFKNEPALHNKKQKITFKRKNKTAQQDLNEDQNASYKNEDFVSNNEEQNDPTDYSVITEVASVQPKDYSMANGDANAAPVASTYSQNYPYVPSTSFSYNNVEDVNVPKHSIAQIEKETSDADLALQKAMKTMNATSLKKIAAKTSMNIKDIHLNIGNLQIELQKCMEQLSSDEIKKDISEKISEADEIRLKKDLETQMQTLQSLGSTNNVKVKRLAQDIMRQQMKLQHIDLKKQQTLIKKLETLNKKLKIVYI